MSGIVLETSTEKGILLLSKKEMLLDAIKLPSGPALSKTIASSVETLIKKHDFQPEYVAVGSGPGLYTGTRVGVSLAMGLSLGWNLPLIQFCGLEAFRFNVFQKHNLSLLSVNTDSFAVLINAGVRGVYVFKNHEASLCSIAKAEEILTDTKLLLSPHPELIRKKFPVRWHWEEGFLDPWILSSLAYRLFLMNGDSTQFS